MGSPAQATWPAPPALHGHLHGRALEWGPLRVGPSATAFPAAQSAPPPVLPRGRPGWDRGSSPHGAPGGDAGVKSVAEPEQDQGCRVPAAHGAVPRATCPSQPCTPSPVRVPALENTTPAQILWWFRADRARHALCVSLAVFRAKGVCGFGAPTYVFAAVGGCCAAVGVLPSLPGSGAGWGRARTIGRARAPPSRCEPAQLRGQGAPCAVVLGGARTPMRGSGPLCRGWHLDGPPRPRGGGGEAPTGGRWSEESEQGRVRRAQHRGLGMAEALAGAHHPRVGGSGSQHRVWGAAWRMGPGLLSPSRLLDGFSQPQAATIAYHK